MSVSYLKRCSLFILLAGMFVNQGALANGFGADTLVRTPGGVKKIQDIVAGDQVVSCAESGDCVVGVVSETYYSRGEAYQIAVQGRDGILDLFIASSEQTFYIDGAWVSAENLISGMTLPVEHDLSHTVEKIHFIEDEELFSFEVDGYHNYFIASYLVHNGGNGSKAVQYGVQSTPTGCRADMYVTSDYCARQLETPKGTYIGNNRSRSGGGR